jgi:DNA invertase Pin-like site-specific DNA recombinase
LTPEQEAKIGAAMLELCRKENQIPRASNSLHRQQQERARANGKLGGRPKTGNNAKMTERAATINRMMLRGLEVEEIAEMLGTTETFVLNAKTKYGLPRSEG